MDKTSSNDTIVEIITMWHSQGYSESEIYRMLTAWEIIIDEEILSHMHQKPTASKDALTQKQKHYNTLL